MPFPRVFHGLIFLGLTGFLSVHAQTNQALVAPPATNASGPSQADLATMSPFQQAVALTRQERYDEALMKINAILQADPKNFDALNLRGYVYSKQKSLDLAEKDFETMLQLEPKSVPAQFNVNEIKFMRKDYDGARPGFLSLVNDADWGDLAAYKVFLCDLLAGQVDASKKELDVFNQTGANPSFYYGNAAWELYNKRPEAARPWLASAAKIYYPTKQENYLSSLKDLGYLPLPPMPTP
jgi:tetratricopeptide (TPR) repeat protein